MIKSRWSAKVTRTDNGGRPAAMAGVGNAGRPTGVAAADNCDRPAVMARAVFHVR